MPELNTEKILDYSVVTEPKSKVLDTISSWMNESGAPKVFVCANPHSLVTADQDREFKQVFQEADLVTPDGIGIVIASKILGGEIADRVTGSDVFYGLSELLNKNSEMRYRYFFLGSSDDTLNKIKHKFAQDYPHIVFSGSYSPPYKANFSEEDNQAMIEAVNAAKTDVLWVGMTAPKQEKWIFQNKEFVEVKFIGAIGAVFDFYVGNVNRAHPIFLRHGLEWLPRLLQEPRRLWRRNFISNPKFLVKVIMQRLREKRGSTVITDKR